MHKIDPKRVKATENHVMDPKGFDKLPHLVSFLSDATYVTDGGTEPREPGTIFIQPRAGVIHCWLKEVSQGLVLHVEVKSISSLLATIEAALGDEGSMWEKDRFARAPKKRNR